MNLGLLADETVHTNLQAHCGDVRKRIVDVLLFLKEADKRRYFADMGYDSLFAYSLVELKMSENEAGPRIAVARLANRFPQVLDHLATGDVHLTGLVRLSPHLKPDNCNDLLARARGKTVKDIEALIAELAPQPDVPDAIRAVPTRPDAAAPEAASPAPAPSPTRAPAPSPAPDPSDQRRANPASEASPSAIPPRTVDSAATKSRRRTKKSARELAAQIRPLSATRHKVQLTVSTELRAKIERARDLMSHRVPNGDLEVIIGEAVDLLLKDLEARRLGKSKRTWWKNRPLAKAATGASSANRVNGASGPTSANDASGPTSANDASGTTSANARAADRANGASAVDGVNGAASANGAGSAKVPANDMTATRRSRGVPRSVRREVFERDGEQCSFVSKSGVRCQSRRLLEVDHIHPHALGGDANVRNVRVLCRTHNRRMAEHVFGADFIERRIREAREQRARGKGRRRRRRRRARRRRSRA